MELMHRDVNSVTRMAREYKVPMVIANLIHEFSDMLWFTGKRNRITRPSLPAWKACPGLALYFLSNLEINLFF